MNTATTKRCSRCGEPLFTAEKWLCIYCAIKLSSHERRAKTLEAVFHDQQRRKAERYELLSKWWFMAWGAVVGAILVTMIGKAL